MNCRISANEYYLHENIRTNSDIEAICPDFKAEKIKKKVGISSRHIAATNETALDLAEKACRKLFHDYNAEKIDFILLCTQSPDYKLPTSACILQDRLGLNKNIGALDFNLGCSGFIYGLSLAKGLISSGTAEHVLLVTAETYSRYIAPDDKGNMSIFGDAAAATIIETSSKSGIGVFELGTNGGGYKNLIVEKGGSRNKCLGGATETLFMDGPEIFNFTLEEVPGLVERVLNKNKFNMESIDYFIFHQANKYMLKTLQNLMNIPDEKFHIELEHTGNTVSSTIPIALKQAEEAKKISPGNHILLAGFGVGYSYGAVTIDY